ncbi:MAG: disulfide bond formation protein B [Rhodovibrio sp.]|nr:disulfide bond formation protein B [Rhodovibrio sp.]
MTRAFRTLAEVRGMPRLASVLVLAGATAALGTALTAQYGFGLEPCHLCIWQRWPHAIAVAGALAALAVRRPVARGGLMAVAALALTAGFGIAVYQIGLQQEFWTTSVCGVGNSGSLSSGNIDQALAGEASTGCAEIATRVFGLSIPAWNAVASAALAAVAGVGAWAAGRSNKAEDER